MKTTLHVTEKKKKKMREAFEIQQWRLILLNSFKVAEEKIKNEKGG